MRLEDDGDGGGRERRPFWWSRFGTQSGGKGGEGVYILVLNKSRIMFCLLRLMKN